MSARIFRGAAVALVLVLLGSTLVSMAREWKVYQWDFKTFYYAGRAHAAGLNPYGMASLEKMARSPVTHRFRYPPLTLGFFRLFSGLDYRTAYFLYLAAKLLALGLLFFLWTRVFPAVRGDAWFFVFALLAFNTTVGVDLLSGNVSIFEQLLLWAGFAALLKRRILLFSLCVFLAAQFKVTPLFFLAVLLFDGDKRKYRWFLGTILAFGAVQAISCATSPLYRDFFVFGRQIESDMPSSLAFIGDLAAAVARLFGAAAPPLLSRVVYAALALAVLGVSLKAGLALRRRFAENREEFLLHLVVLACLAYAVIIPRFPAYSQIILILPAFFMMKRYLPGSEGVWFFVLAVLQVPAAAGLPGMDVPLEIAWKSQPILIVVALWGVLVAKIGRGARAGKSPE